MNEENRPIVILLADDDEEDRMLTRDALKESGLKYLLQTVEDGEELLDYLHQRNKFAPPAAAPRPDLILLDLNMPKMDGREALREIKANQNLRQIPIVVMTTSKADEDIFRSYDSGASSFISKPVTFESLVRLLRGLGQYWFELVRLPKQEAQL